MRFVIWVWGAALAALLCIANARAEEGCSKDIECKGERICVRHECVDPSSVPPAPPPEAAVPASYQPPPPAIAPKSPTAFDTRHRHLGGFIRPDLGFGYQELHGSSGGTDFKMNGFSATFGFAAGGAVSENSILAVHFWDTATSNPSVSSGGLSGTTSDTTLSVFAIGPQYTIYTGGNYYFSVTPALSRVTLRANGSSGDSDWGFGLRTAVGKEWWVSDHWGLGLAGHLSFSVNKDSGSSDATLTGWGATIAFSATYN